MKSFLTTISGIRLDGNMGVVVLLLCVFTLSYFHAVHSVHEDLAVQLFGDLIKGAWAAVLVLIKSDSSRSTQRATDRPQSGQGGSV